MTAQHFEEWFHDALMPNIQPNSLIVMDNAPYHSRRLEPVPTMSSRKQVMQDWLTSHRICFPECALKQELHEVECLPPYQCELNPIELTWSQVKRHIKDNNSLFMLSAVKDLTHEGFQKVDSSLWKKLVKHVRREFEGKYWVDDGLQEEHIEEFIIRLGGDGDDESSSETSGNESSSDEAFSD